MVNLMYDHLSVARGYAGKPLHVFWDKQCLNIGQNWEKEFMHGLINSKVIVLLISNTVSIPD